MTANFSIYTSSALYYRHSIYLQLKPFVSIHSQCRHCRGINYGRLDSFLCSECGYCRFCRIDLQLLAAPAWELPPPSTEKEVRVTNIL